MAHPIPADRHDRLSILESQVRDCFGRVVYSHKTHEKCADIQLTTLRRVKLWQLVLSAITTGGLLAAVFGSTEQSRWAAGLSALVSTALLALNAYTKDNDPGQTAQMHKAAADQLWRIREAYLALLADIRTGDLDVTVVRARRDDLQELLAAAHEAAPRTTAKGYAHASRALKIKEDLTFSDAEIDQFLPQPLRKASRA